MQPRAWGGEGGSTPHGIHVIPGTAGTSHHCLRHYHIHLSLIDNKVKGTYGAKPGPTKKRRLAPHQPQ